MVAQKEVIDGMTWIDLKEGMAIVHDGADKLVFLMKRGKKSLNTNEKSKVEKHSSKNKRTKLPARTMNLGANTEMKPVPVKSARLSNGTFVPK